MMRDHRNTLRAVSPRLGRHATLVSLAALAPHLSACGAEGDDQPAPPATAGQTAPAPTGGAAAPADLPSQLTARLTGKRLYYEQSTSDSDTSVNGSVFTNYTYQVALDLCPGSFTWEEFERSCTTVNVSGGSNNSCDLPDSYDSSACAPRDNGLACAFRGTWSIQAQGAGAALALQTPQGQLALPIALEGDGVLLNGNRGQLLAASCP